MYHSISDDPEPGVRPYYRVCTSPRRFREQMQWLKDNGYRGVTLSAGLGLAEFEIRANSALRTAALRVPPCRFDFRRRLPRFLHGCLSDSPGVRLHRHHVSAHRVYWFQIGNRKSEIGNTSFAYGTSLVTCHAPLFHGRECLTWEEIHELHRAGIEFGSHTVHHPELVHLLVAGNRIGNRQFKIRNRKSFGRSLSRRSPIPTPFRKPTGILWAGSRNC